MAAMPKMRKRKRTKLDLRLGETTGVGGQPAPGRRRAGEEEGERRAEGKREWGGQMSRSIEFLTKSHPPMRFEWRGQEICHVVNPRLLTVPFGQFFGLNLH